jgi:urease accessory protein
MLELIKRVDQGEPIATLTLPLEQRVRSRLRVTLDDGTVAGVFLQRGQVLRDGDLLASAEGQIVRVRAAAEPVSEVRCDDPLLLARACYHLGNRHVPLQIEGGLLRYQHDHVLDEMLRGLGLRPSSTEAPFQPEPGAYGGAAHGHPHGHGDTGHTTDDHVH